MSEWKPIETAPKDGMKILAFTKWGDIEITEWFQIWTDKYIETDGGLFRKEKELFSEGWNGNLPTHWQPLPPPPAQ